MNTEQTSKNIFTEIQSFENVSIVTLGRSFVYTLFIVRFRSNISMRRAVIINY